MESGLKPVLFCSPLIPIPSHSALSELSDEEFEPASAILHGKFCVWVGNGFSKAKNVALKVKQFLANKSLTQCTKSSQNLVQITIPIIILIYLFYSEYGTCLPVISIPIIVLPVYLVYYHSYCLFFPLWMLIFIL